MATLTRCPVCGSAHAQPVLELRGLPVLMNAQVRPDAAPDVARGDIELVVCTECSHLYNRAFDESLLDYDASYENTLHYSPQFQAFAKELVERLITDHDLVGAEIAELGSGPGHLLAMLCEAGVARAHGYDPSYDAERLGAPTHDAVTISTDLFPDDGSLPVKLAFSQHVLEHLHDPVAALAAQRVGVAAMGGVVYSEVPNGELMVEEVALWDLIYEHLSYFTPTSLTVANARAGLAVGRIDAAFGAQFLWAEAQPDETVDATPDADDVAARVAASVDFGEAARRAIVDARESLAAYREVGPVVLWGAGSKGMTYLNLVADTPDAVAGVIDINPRKDGWGVPGTSLEISMPESLVDIRPATVLIANPVYAGEIGAQVAELGVDATVKALWG